MQNFLLHFKNPNAWAYGLLTAIITGGSDAIYQYLTQPSIDYRHCLAVGIGLALAYLKASPLPPLENK